jgi:hypothetical protein
MMVEREVDGDMLHLLPLQGVVLAAAVVVSVGQAAAEADFEAVVTELAVVMLLAAEVEMREAEWTEPTSQSAKYITHK